MILLFITTAAVGF